VGAPLGIGGGKTITIFAVGFREKATAKSGPSGNGHKELGGTKCHCIRRGRDRADTQEGGPHGEDRRKRGEGIRVTAGREKGIEDRPGAILLEMAESLAVSKDQGLLARTDHF